MTRIGIIGMGWVGSSVAMSTLHAGVAQHLLVNDLRDTIAEGEAMDLAHGAAFYPPAQVRSAPLADFADTDAVVIAAGRGGKADESRLGLARDNARVVGEIARAFRGYRGVVVIVTNPVDVLTYVFAQASGLPEERVIGTGTMLDTARLRQMVGRRLAVDVRSVHAQVVGEHGDSEVVLWSGAQVGGVPLRRWPEWHAAEEQSIADQVRTAAYEIIRRKGATNHAIGLVTAALLRTILRGDNRVLTVSRVQRGALGLADVALSLPTIVGAGGAARVLEPELDAIERERVLRSAATLREAIGQVNT